MPKAKKHENVLNFTMLGPGTVVVFAKTNKISLNLMIFSLGNYAEVIGHAKTR